MFAKRLFLIAFIAAVLCTAGCGRKHFCRDKETSYAPAKDCDSCDR